MMPTDKETLAAIMDAVKAAGLPEPEFVDHGTSGSHVTAVEWSTPTIRFVRLAWNHSTDTWRVLYLPADLPLRAAVPFEMKARTTQARAKMLTLAVQAVARLVKLESGVESAVRVE